MFTAANWDVPQAVTVSAAADADTAGDRAAVAHTVTSADGVYDGVAAAGFSPISVDSSSASSDVVLEKRIFASSESCPRIDSGMARALPLPTGLPSADALAVLLEAATAPPAAS